MPAPLPLDGSLDDGRCPHHARLIRCPNASLSPHPCPYLEEINDDKKTLCRCCEACMDNCADDI